MGGINLPCKRISNTLCRYSALKEVENNSILLNCALQMVIFFQIVQYGRREAIVS
jgi:hypothetical protein